MLGDRISLLLYLAFTVCVSFAHDPFILTLLLAGVFGFALIHRRDLHRARRSIIAVLVFNASVTVSYLIFSWWTERPVGTALLSLNLRSVTIACATFLFFARIPAYRAFSFSGDLTYFVALAGAFVTAYSRLLSDSKRSLESRAPVQPGPADAYRHAAAIAVVLLRRAERDAQQATLALRSRGLPV